MPKACGLPQAFKFAKLISNACPRFLGVLDLYIRAVIWWWASPESITLLAMRFEPVIRRYVEAVAAEPDRRRATNIPPSASGFHAHEGLVYSGDSDTTAVICLP
jgi:hypothetical protein